jgi:hypothetical protein
MIRRHGTWWILAILLALLLVASPFLFRPLVGWGRTIAYLAIAVWVVFLLGAAFFVGREGLWLVLLTPFALASVAPQMFFVPAIYFYAATQCVHVPHFNQVSFPNNHAYHALLAANEKIPTTMRGQIADVTSEVQQIMLGDTAQQIADSFYEIYQGAGHSETLFETGKDYFFGIDEAKINQLDIPHSNFCRNYEFGVHIRYRSDTDYDLVEATVTDHTAWP